MKLAALVAVPAAVVTVTGPLTAPQGTVAVICVALATEKNAGAPAKVTALAPVKPLPVRVTLVPTAPEAGVKLASLGPPVTVKLAALVAVPATLLTVTGPLAAPQGTMAVIFVALHTVKDAGVPAKQTALAPAKPLPVRVTLVPTAPEAGVKPASVGAAMTLKLTALVAVPPGVVTVTGPLVAP